MSRLIVRNKKHTMAMRAIMGALQREVKHKYITIHCGYRYMKIYRTVLSQHSPHFRRMFRKIRALNPLITLAIPYEDLAVIIEIMYTGQASMPADQLRSLQLTVDKLMLSNVQFEIEVETPGQEEPMLNMDDQQSQRPGPSGLCTGLKVSLTVPEVRTAGDLPALENLMSQVTLCVDLENLELWSDGSSSDSVSDDDLGTSWDAEDEQDADGTDQDGDGKEKTDGQDYEVMDSDVPKTIN